MKVQWQVILSKVKAKQKHHKAMAGRAELLRRVAGA